MLVLTKASHTGHPALLQMSLGQEAILDHCLSAHHQNSQERWSNCPSLNELSGPGTACPPLARGQGHAVQEYLPHLVLREKRLFSGKGDYEQGRHSHNANYIYFGLV